MKKVVSLCAFALLAGSVMADVEEYNGDTTGAPTFNRALAGNPPTGLSGVGTAVAYEVIPMYTNINASVIFDIIAAGPGFDTFMHLYGPGGFNPASALSNVIIGDDDSGAGANSLFTTNLMGGTQYYVVVSGFDNGDFGTFTLQMSSTSADITIGMIPAPSALAMLGLTGLVARRRR
ncbi:MAG: hypothetical protein KF902_02360 [Phycisphaeraceae bacterium]|nr:hypothetical protein [Phycisphaeraceae bacterium]MCW5768349.1 hypothetical protein [Phycisphaeraceae bacterium]